MAYPKLQRLKKDLTALVTKHRLSEYSGVAPLVLTTYVIDCLCAFNNAWPKSGVAKHVVQQPHAVRSKTPTLPKR